MNSQKYIQKSQVKQNQDPILTLILIFELFERNQAKNRRENNSKKPKQFIIPEEEESVNYFSTSEDEVINIEPENGENSCIEEIFVNKLRHF